MIEIKTSPDARPITPDGPHDHEGTRAIADGIDAAFRLLNYATSPDKNGLTYPSDVYSVLGELAAALAKLPQALHQMRQFIAAEIEAGHARENPHYGSHNGDVDAAHADLEDAVINASGYADALYHALASAQSAVRGLESTRR